MAQKKGTKRARPSTHPQHQRADTAHSARFLAAEILDRLFARPQPLKPLFDRRTADLKQRDLALCKELVYGVLRRRQQLDRALDLLSLTPLNKITPFLHQVLAVGLYQLLFTTIPESAAVNEAVKSCREQRRPPVPKRLYGFVNGVLRSAIRRRPELTEKMCTDAGGEPILNHPEWLTDRWRQRYGDERCRELCAVCNRRPALTLRLDTTAGISREMYAARLQALKIPCRPGRFSPQALLLPEGGAVSTLPGLADGLVQVQDQAAQLACLLLAPFTAVRCLDACAGLGGKTGHLLQLFPKSRVHAVEPEPFRAKKLAAAAGKNHDRLTVHTADLLTLAPETLPRFHRILVDAPCSGLGISRRQPDIRWNRTPQQFDRFQQQQLALLNRAILFAADDVIVVYATCSTEPEENDEVVRRFLTSHPEFRSEESAPCLPAAARRFTRDAFFSPLPDEEIDGFFAVRLVRGTPE